MLKVYFCAVKWKALIALFVLVATVIIPAAQSVLNEQEVSLFIVDEEKGNSTGKIFSPTEEHLPAYHILNFLPILSDDPIAMSQIPVERALEFQTPPPDVC
jgi:hypothetical protein